MELLDNYQGNADLPVHVSVPGYIPSTISCPPHAAATATDTGVGVGVAASKGKQAARRENCKKRKTDQSQNPKVVAEEDSKSTTSGSTITNNKNSKAPSGNVSKVSDVPKPDYIHVRARRGQATDSHSLAERVRREKISERMRYLQDLVPGCNRITGKAGMLDEIINYVQSLQRQVEFLSMKLASIDTMPEFDVDGYLTKEMFHSCPSSLPAIGTSTHMVNPANIQFNAFGNGTTDSSIEMGVNHPIDVAIRRTISAPVSFPDTFLDSPSLNHMTWEDELQNLYGVAYQQQRSTPYLSQPFTGFNGAGNVKLEM